MAGAVASMHLLPRISLLEDQKQLALPLTAAARVLVDLRMVGGNKEGWGWGGVEKVRGGAAKCDPWVRETRGDSYFFEQDWDVQSAHLPFSGHL